MTETVTHAKSYDEGFRDGMELAAKIAGEPHNKRRRGWGWGKSSIRSNTARQVRQQLAMNIRAKLAEYLSD